MSHQIRAKSVGSVTHGTRKALLLAASGVTLLMASQSAYAQDTAPPPPPPMTGAEIRARRQRDAQETMRRLAELDGPR